MPIDQNLVYCITGGAGFVGAVVTRKLIAQGARVHIIIKESTNTWRINDILDEVTVHYHDLSSVASLSKILHKIKPDIMYHLAVRGAYPTQNDFNDIFQTDLLGTWNLLQAADAIPYQLLVNTGSSSEYGAKMKPMKETDVLEPNSYYAIAKAAATHLASYVATNQRKPIVTARLFSAYGPFEQSNRLLPNLMKALHTGQPLALTDPTTARDFIYVDDVANFYLQTKKLQKYAGEVFNVGTGKQTTLKQLIIKAEKVTGKKLRAKWGDMPDRTWDTTRWVANMQKAKKSLQWTPDYSLEQGLAAHWDWFLTHSDFYE